MVFIFPCSLLKRKEKKREAYNKTTSNIFEGEGVILFKGLSLMISLITGFICL